MVLAALAVAAGAALLGTLQYGHWTVKDDAMLPRYRAGTGVWGRKHPYADVGQVRRGDVVVTRRPASPHDPGGESLGRVVGLPGDRIALRIDRLMLDGREASLRLLRQDQELEIFEETPPGPPAGPGSEVVRRWEIALPRHVTPGGGDLPETTVPAGHVFVLGDNRRGSTHDSRARGPLPFDAIVARLAP